MPGGVDVMGEANSAATVTVSPEQQSSNQVQGSLTTEGTEGTEGKRTLDGLPTTSSCSLVMTSVPSAPWPPCPPVAPALAGSSVRLKRIEDANCPYSI
jgi:hypothetical protein